MAIWLMGCDKPRQKEMSTSKSSIPSAVHPKWAKNTSIYEVNIRQYTPEGTIRAFTPHLDQIKSLGVDVIWLMPIYPVGELNRKGSLGSGYSIKDYRAVNPDMGTLDDLQALVDKAHGLDMHVLLDWVANHTAWDNSLTTEHPEWYTMDSLGNFMSPVPDWSDVIDLNYDNEGLRTYMIESLKYWVEAADIDGYRCDMAHMVPTAFWDSARVALDAIKPVFMLAETENPDLLYQAFDMNYTWELFHIMEAVASGSKNVQDIRDNLKKEATKYGPDAYRMYFTTNHDENSWAGTVFERFGDGAEAFAALTVMLPGMPLVYSGQEAGLNKRLPFFEKDTINWQNTTWRKFYTTLLTLKKNNKALWNGTNGGQLIELSTSAPDEIFAFTREKDGQTIVALFNLSPKTMNFTLESTLELKKMNNIFTNELFDGVNGDNFVLGPWNYLILTN